MHATRTHRPCRTARAQACAVLALAFAAVAACSDSPESGGDSASTSAAVTTVAASAPATAGTSAEGGQPSSPSAPSTAVDGHGDAATPGECPVDALPESGPPVEITLWHAMAATTGVVLEDLIAQYNAAQDRVHVTPVFQGGYAETFDKYVNTMRSDGELPTIAQLSEIYLQPMVDSQSIVPVADCIAAGNYDLSDYPEMLLDQYRLDGVLVTMPFQLSNPVLYYDGNDFVAAGLDPADPPATFDQLLATSRALVDSGVVTSGIVLPIDSWPVEQWITTAGELLVDHDNGRSARAEHARFDTDVVAGLLQSLQAMHDEGLLQVTGRGGEQAGLAPYVAVAQGQAAMTIGSSATLGEIYAQISRVPDVDVRVGPFPGQGGHTTVAGGSLYMTNAADAAQRAAAWDLLAWLNEPAQQVTWSIGTGYVPTRLSAADDPQLVQLWDERPGFRVAWDQITAEGQVPGGGGPVIGDYLGVRDAIEDGLEALYAGDDPSSVQAELQQSADEVIEAYNERVGG